MLLLYANKTEERIIFKNDLKQLANQYTQFDYIDFISGNKRISKNDLTKLDDAFYYICGPDSLKDTIMRDLSDLEIPKSNINIEHFADGYKPWFGLL